MKTVANCTQCNRIFKRHLSPMCPECHQAYMEKLSSVYRFIQENPQLTLEDIAEQCKLPYREVETFFFKGKLGTATSQVIYHCQLCNRPLAANMRKGRFCFSCSEQFENEARLNESPMVEKAPAVKVVPSKTSLDEDTAPVASPLPEREEPAASTESYGFKRLNSEW